VLSATQRRSDRQEIHKLVGMVNRASRSSTGGPNTVHYNQG